MYALLKDERLHQYFGGRPPTRAQVRDRYMRPENGRFTDTGWFHWIVRERTGGQATGTIAAGVNESVAELVWLVGVPWQGRGFASEAAAGLIDWLHKRGVCDLIAKIHPDHEASARVARRIGFQPSDEVVDGEVVWRKKARFVKPS